MKEYLFKYNDQYTLVELSKEDAESNPEQYIEVPDGATMYAEDSNMGVKGNYFFRLRSDGFDYEAVWLNKNWMRASFDVRNVNVLWVRETLNDKIASAEVARQNQPNQKTMDAMSEVEGIFSEKHNHYKKDVSHLKMIDPYRISDLYDLHPCADHIMKKSLCAGNRGHKDTLRDIQDIIDTAERWKQMIEEDNNEI